VTVHGQTAHAGEGNRAGPGLNAIEASLPLLQALGDLKARVAQRTSALPAPPHNSVPLAAQLNIAALHGGTCGGQVPSLFDITISRRYMPEENFEEARAEIEALVAQARDGAPGLRFDVALIGHLTPVEDPDGPHWPRWQAAFGHGFGYAPESFSRWGSASCSDFGYVQRTGMREVLLGGLGRQSRLIHSPGEHTTTTDIASLARAVLVYLARDFMPQLRPESSSL
jgi:succinyl-diaminopimelate desuccinylase